MEQLRLEGERIPWQKLSVDERCELIEQIEPVRKEGRRIRSAARAKVLIRPGEQMEKLTIPWAGAVEWKRRPVNINHNVIVPDRAPQGNSRSLPCRKESEWESPGTADEYRTNDHEPRNNSGLTDSTTRKRSALKKAIDNQPANR